jgi:hypothetical protein
MFHILWYTIQYGAYADFRRARDNRWMIEVFYGTEI